MQELINTFMEYREILKQGVFETLYMTFVSVLLAYVLGLQLGILLVITSANGLLPNRVFNLVLGMIVNIGRSIPFIIVIVVLIPFTRMIVGTAIGSTAAIVPLVIAAAPFVARMVESSLDELDQGVIDAARSMGANTFQIITKVMLPESVPSLIRGLSITTITMISYSAMAGAVGAGGLGHIAIRYGFQRYETEVMFITIVLLVLIVAIIQFLFNILAAAIDKK